MNKYLIGLVLLTIGILSVATSSIAIECYNKNAEIKKEKQHSFNFVIVTLVSGILTILCSFLVFMMPSAS